MITSQVTEELGREVPLRALFEAPVLRDYAALCDAAAVRDTTGGLVAHAATGDDAPLSVMQERLWLLEEIENGSGQNALTGRYHPASTRSGSPASSTRPPSSGPSPAWWTGTRRCAPWSPTTRAC